MTAPLATTVAMAVLPWLWAAAVVGAGWRLRPVVDAAPTARSLGVRARLGRLLRRLAGRPVDPAADRWAGGAALLTLASAAMSPILAIAVVATALAVPRLRRHSAERRAQAALVAELPDVVDRFVLAAGAGLTVRLATEAVAERAEGAIGAALRDSCRRTSLGARTADALATMPERLGEPVRPLVDVLVSADRYGTPLVAALERLADESRIQRRRAAEEAARRLPVKLLFPLVCCTLPAFALLTVIPLLLGAFRSLRL